MNTGQTPRIDKAIAIAKVLKVPVAWLWDNSIDWPPPTAPTATACITDRELAEELGRRRDLIRQERKQFEQRLLRADRLPEAERICAAAEQAGRPLTDAEFDFVIKEVEHDVAMRDYLGLKLADTDPDRGRTIPPEVSTVEFIHPFPAFSGFRVNFNNPADRGSWKNPQFPHDPGQVVTAEEFAALDMSLQRGYVPLYVSFERDPLGQRPVLQWHGQPPPSHIKEYLRTDLKGALLFAIRVTDALAESCEPLGAILVCSPTGDLAEDDTVLYVPAEDRAKAAILPAEPILADHPNYRVHNDRSFATRDHYFRIIARYPAAVPADAAGPAAPSGSSPPPGSSPPLAGQAAPPAPTSGRSADAPATRADPAPPDPGRGGSAPRPPGQTSARGPTDHPTPRPRRTPARPRRKRR